MQQGTVEALGLNGDGAGHRRTESDWRGEEALGSFASDRLLHQATRPSDRRRGFEKGDAVAEDALQLDGFRHLQVSQEYLVLVVVDADRPLSTVAIEVELDAPQLAFVLE